MTLSFTVENLDINPRIPNQDPNSASATLRFDAPTVQPQNPPPGMPMMPPPMMNGQNTLVVPVAKSDLSNWLPGTSIEFTRV